MHLAFDLLAEVERRKVRLEPQQQRACLQTM